MFFGMVPGLYPSRGILDVLGRDLIILSRILVEREKT